MKNGRIVEWKKNKQWENCVKPRRRRKNEEEKKCPKRIRKHKKKFFPLWDPLYLLASEKYQINYYYFQNFLSTEKVLHGNYLCATCWVACTLYWLLHTLDFWANLCPNTWLYTRHRRQGYFFKLQPQLSSF